MKSKKDNSDRSAFKKDYLNSLEVEKHMRMKFLESLNTDNLPPQLKDPGLSLNFTCNLNGCGLDVDDKYTGPSNDYKPTPFASLKLKCDSDRKDCKLYPAVGYKWYFN